MKLKKVLKFLLPFLATSIIATSVALTQVSCASDKKPQIQITNDKIMDLKNNFDNEYKDVSSYKFDGVERIATKASTIKKYIIDKLGIPEELIWNFSLFPISSLIDEQWWTIYISLKNDFFPRTIVNIDEYGNYIGDEILEYDCTSNYLKFNFKTPFNTIILDIYTEQQLKSEVQKLVDNILVYWDTSFENIKDYIVSDEYDYLLKPALNIESKFSIIGFQLLSFENIKLISKNENNEKYWMSIHLTNHINLIFEFNNQFWYNYYFSDIVYNLKVLDFKTFGYELKKCIIQSNCFNQTTIEDFKRALKKAENMFNDQFNFSVGKIKINLFYLCDGSTFIINTFCSFPPNYKIINFEPLNFNFFREGFYRNEVNINYIF